MKLKQKPVKPKKEKRIPLRLPLCSYGEEKSLLDLINWAKENNIDPKDTELVYDSDEYGGFELDIVGHVGESDETFNVRMELYKKKLKEYNEWYSKNKEAIDEEIRKRKAKQQKERREKEKRKKEEIKAAIKGMDWSIEELKEIFPKSDHPRLRE